MTTASKSAVTVVAAAMAAVLCTQMAYAEGQASGITPTVVWSRNLGQSYTIDGKTYAFKINPGTGTINQDGTLTVANVWNGYPAPYINISADGATSVSVLVKFSGLSLPVSSDSGVCIADMADSDGNQVGAYIAQNASRLSAFNVTGNVLTQLGLNGSENAVVGSGYMLYSYSTTGGVKVYMGSSIANLIGGQKNDYKFGNRTISKVSIGGDAQGKCYDHCGFTIEEVALFVNEFYTADDVASYEFPAKIYSSNVTVSTINTDHPDETEIDVYLADGVTVTDDTTFTATKVNFHCYGSFNMTPPANNEAVFDFSQGRPVLKYTGFFPAVSGTTFTSNSIPTSVNDASSWKGTVWVRGAAMTNLNPDTYGNGSSTLRLSGCQGHFAQGSINCNVAIELVNDGYSYGIYVDNGYSRASNTPNNRVVINTLKGTGAVWTGGSAGNVLINVRDWSEFTGPLQFVNKILVLGEDIPAIDDFNVAGSIYIGAGETLTATSQLRADGGIYVNGGLSLPNVSTTYIREGTTNYVSDTGVLTLTNSGNIDDTTVNYSCIQGTGTLKLVSQGNYYRCVSAVNFPTNMTVQTELEGGFLLKNNGAEYTIGSLAGSGYIRSDWNNGDRNLRILQAKDTTYGGVFDAAIDRIGTVTVAPGVSTAGTLTLSGTQTASNALSVESGAKVNLTGTWVGATTVAGTLGGTGAITGDLTLSDGATLKVNDINDTLDVTGALTASLGTVRVDLPAGTPTQSGVKIISATGTITTGAKFKVTIDGEKTSLRVIKKSGFLKAVLPGLKIILR